jgi:hypothetical protein
MSTRSELVGLLQETNDLLQQAGETQWEDHIARLTENLQAAGPEQLKTIARQIRAIFGGTGSFSDLVLYRNGNPSIEANDRLEALRSRLHRALVFFSFRE